MSSLMVSALDMCAAFLVLNRVKDKDPWITAKLLSLIRERDDLKTKADRLFNNNNFIAFKKKRNEVKRLTIKAKRDYIISELNNADLNPRKYWSELRNVFPNKKDKNAVKPTINLCRDGRTISIEETAEVFKDHFVTVGSNLANKIKEDNMKYLSDFMLDSTENILNWEPVNLEEVVLKGLSIVCS